jgi:hypothetical protein
MPIIRRFAQNTIVDSRRSVFAENWKNCLCSFMLIAAETRTMIP